MTVSKGVLSDYREAVRERDWPRQAGILMSLLRNVVRHRGTEVEKIAAATAEEVLRDNDRRREELLK